MTKIIALSTYGKQKVKSLRPNEKKSISAWKVGRGIEVSVLLDLIPGSFDHKTTRHSYHFIELPVDVYKMNVKTYSHIIAIGIDNQTFQEVKDAIKLYPGYSGLMYFNEETSKWHTFDNAMYAGREINDYSIDALKKWFNYSDFLQDEEIVVDELDITVEFSKKYPNKPGWWWVIGDTRPIKESLKAMGFHWKRSRQAWAYIGDELPEEAKELLGYSDKEEAAPSAPEFIDTQVEGIEVGPVEELIVPRPPAPKLEVHSVKLESMESIEPDADDEPEEQESKEDIYKWL